MTLQFEIPAEDRARFNEERYQHPIPLVQRRMEALWLKSHNLPHAQIAELVGVTENTIRAYFRLYREGGIEALRVINYHRPESELVQHVKRLEAYFREHPPASIKEAQAMIQEITGIRRSATQVREFLKKNSVCVISKSG